MFSHSQSRLRSCRIFVSCTFQMQLHAKTQICTPSLIRNLKVHETTKDLKVVWMMQFCDRDLFGVDHIQFRLHEYLFSFTSLDIKSPLGVNVGIWCLVFQVHGPFIYWLFLFDSKEIWMKDWI